MPQNLSGNPASFPDQRAPLPGEPRTAGSVALGFQDAADRTQHLLDRLVHIDPAKGGVRRVRRAVDLAALQAASDHVDTTICAVKGYGLYEYDATFAGAQDLPFVVKPNDVGAGLGAWLLQLRNVIGGANGVARLDGSGKIPVSYLTFTDGTNRVRAEEVRNGLISTRIFDVPEAITITDGGAHVDIPSLGMTLNLLKGDRFLVNLAIRAWVPSSDTHCRVFMKNTDPFAIERTRLCGWYISTGNELTELLIPCVYTYTAMDDGVHTLAVSAASDYGAADYEIRHVGGFVQVIRP